MLLWFTLLQQLPASVFHCRCPRGSRVFLEPILGASSVSVWCMSPFIVAPSTGSPPFNWIETGPLGLNKRGHWRCLGRNCFSTSSFAIACPMKTGSSRDSPIVSRIDLASSSCLKVWLFGKQSSYAVWRRKKTSLLELPLTWLQISPFLLPWKSVAYAQ